MKKQLNREDGRNGDGIATEAVRRRRPYSPPKILSREAIEAVAGPCAKVDPASCPDGVAPTS